MDYLIVGQGLAGSLLAWHLIQRNQRVLVVDLDEPVTSSKVAAGLITPIAGQYFSLPVGADDYINFAKQTYWDIEERTGEILFHHSRIARLFHSEAEIQKWNKRLNSASGERYTNHYSPPSEFTFDESLIRGELGGIELTRGGWLDVPAFLKAIQHLLLEQLGYAIGRVDSTDLDFLPDRRGVRWQNITAKKVIFCQGWQGSNNPYFAPIPMNNAQGDILQIECAPLAKETRILNRNGWILPIGQNQFRAGATYDHDYTSPDPTAAGRETVCKKIRSIIKPEFEILSQTSAIRPIITRHDPCVMGEHPQRPELVYLNGLGSKGVSRGPAMTRYLVDYLLDGKPLPRTLDIRERFEF